MEPLAGLPARRRCDRWLRTRKTGTEGRRGVVWEAVGLPAALRRRPVGRSRRRGTVFRIDAQVRADVRAPRHCVRGDGAAAAALR